MRSFFGIPGKLIAFSAAKSFAPGKDLFGGSFDQDSNGLTWIEKEIAER